ncbi:hypothetical protein HDU92_003595 [Lobulomyces angularis]|nr:hypothetical protein HDU92_003595 [Lobulomyces angularis]
MIKTESHSTLDPLTISKNTAEPTGPSFPLHFKLNFEKIKANFFNFNYLKVPHNNNTTNQYIPLDLPSFATNPSKKRKFSDFSISNTLSPELQHVKNTQLNYVSSPCIQCRQQNSDFSTTEPCQNCLNSESKGLSSSSSSQPFEENETMNLKTQTLSPKFIAKNTSENSFPNLESNSNIFLSSTSPRRQSLPLPLNSSSQQQQHQVQQQINLFTCSYQNCNRQFTRKFDFNRHTLVHTKVKTFQCEKCPKSFARLDALRKHQKVKGNCKTLNDGRKLNSNVTKDDTLFEKL